MNQRYEKCRQYVGIDRHRRRSVVLRMDGEGEVVDCVRIDNLVPNLVAEVAKAGPGAEVAVEATHGWVRHEALFDRVGCKDPPAACRSRSLKLEAA